MISGISLFASAGIGELLINKTDVRIKLANELLPKRAECYSFLHKKTQMVAGDITSDAIKKGIVDFAHKNQIKFLLATPPCQGFSTLGKNKDQETYKKDARNFLIFHTLEVIDQCDFDYILIENVPNFLEMLYPWNNQLVHILDILKDKYSKKYTIEAKVLNAENYGICQSRPRSIVKMYRKGLSWGWPQEEAKIPLKDAIGDLPSLEAGQSSDIPWHYAKKENERTILAMKHTPEGCSALKNAVFYPKKEDGTRIKGFHNTFKRMKWNEPCPARTTYCGSMTSHNNVHPGRALPDGTYSDARPLTLYETFVVSSIPTTIKFPNTVNDNFIRTVIGEAVPPMLLSKIVKMIGK